MTTGTLHDVEIDPLTKQPRCTHIVKQTADKTAAALVMESRVYGAELTALCGYRWIASRDPANLPLCQACFDIYESKVDPAKGLPDA